MSTDCMVTVLYCGACKGFYCHSPTNSKSNPINIGNRFMFCSRVMFLTVKLNYPES